jgi:IclR family mhp operon transcriptional activator
MEKDVGIRAISRGIAVLQAVNRHGSLTMMQIANEVGLPYPTTCRIIDTLVGYGMIKRDSGRKRYSPTALVQTLSLGYQQEDRLAVVSRPFIVELTRRLTWPLSVCSRVGMTMVIRESTHALTPFTLNVYHSGYALPLLASSSGKAYLAFCSDEERNVIIDGVRHLPNAVGTNLASMERVLDQIRHRGFSIEDRLQHTANPGRTSSISAPIFEGEGLAGTLTLIYFASSMVVDKAIEQFADPIKACAQGISLRLSQDEAIGHRMVVSKSPAREPADLVAV